MLHTHSGVKEGVQCAQVTRQSDNTVDGGMERSFSSELGASKKHRSSPAFARPTLATPFSWTSAYITSFAVYVDSIS